MPQIPKIYLSNGNFLVYDYESCSILRGKRIIGNFIGCSPKYPHQLVSSGLPCLLNHYVIKLVALNKWAEFVVLEPKECLVDAQHQYKIISNELEKSSRLDYINQRENELKKRNIEASTSRLGTFDPAKIKAAISDEPLVDMSPSKIVKLSQDEVDNYLKIDQAKWAIFNDLHIKGYYITPGSRYSCDFLAYAGDPQEFHAQYAVRLVPNKGNHIDLEILNYNEINALYRLCHGANKIVIFATVFEDQKTILSYWSMKDRNYLMPDSSSHDLEQVNLDDINDVDFSQDDEYQNKYRKTSPYSNLSKIC